MYGYYIESNMSGYPQQQPQQLMRGGAPEFVGAADYMTAAAGGPGQQQAVPGQGNMLAYNNVGGRRRKGRKGSKSRKGRKGSRSRGGYGLTQVMVPAALMAANYAYGTRQNVDRIVPNFSMRRSRRSRSRRFRR
jgi:hypothetical protein